MSDILISHLLVYILLIPVALRAFLIKDRVDKQEYDVLSVFSFISFLLSILIIYTFGLSLVSIITFIFSLIVFLVNLRAFFGLLMKLNMSYFGNFFKTLCVFQLIIIVFACGVLIMFKPLSVESMNTDVTKQLYYGSNYRGFFEREELFDSVNVKITKIVKSRDLEEEIEEPLAEEEKPLVIYVPDIFSTVEDAMISLNYIAQQGFEVWGFDFAAKDISYFSSFYDRFFIRSFAARLYKYFSPTEFNNMINTITENKKLEIISAMSIVESTSSRDIYVFAEGNVLVSAKSAQTMYPSVIKGVYGFNTEDNLDKGFPIGYGDFPCLMPIEAFCLGLQKQDGTIPQKRAIQAAKYFNELIENEKEIEKSIIENIEINNDTQEEILVNDTL